MYYMSNGEVDSHNQSSVDNEKNLSCQNLVLLQLQFEGFFLLNHLIVHHN